MHTLLTTRQHAELNHVTDGNLHDVQALTY